MPVATLPVIFLTSFAVGFSGAIVPGPLLVLSIRESVRQGFIAGPLVVLGHAALELFVVVGLAIGVATFLQESLSSFIIAILGGLFLFWMGYGMARHPSRHILPEGQKPTTSGINTSGWMKSILGGATVSLLNPYWSLWWATIGLGYILWATDLGATGVASFYTGHILSDLVWYSIVALAIASGRRIMTNSVYQGLIVVCGLFLLILGGFFIYSAVGFFQDFLAS